MKKNGGLMAMVGMALVFGLFLPQNIEAADEAGMQRLGLYLDNVVEGKKLNNTEVDEIEKIIRKDGKVDGTEINFIRSYLKFDSRFNNQLLSDELREIIQVLRDDFAAYNDDVKIKYPELVELDNKLPIDLRDAINQLGILNIQLKRLLSGDKKLDAGLKNFRQSEIVYGQKQLEKLRQHLAISPYKEVLQKIYDTEKLLLEENQKRLSEL